MPYGVALGVGNQEEPITSVMGAKGCRWDAVPFRIEPARGQVPENSLNPPNKESCHVLHEDVAGSKLANEPEVFSPETGALSVEASALAGKADVLTREASTQDVNGGGITSSQGADVVEEASFRPVLPKDFLRIGVALHLPEDLHPGPLQAQV
jgi:hypothetical protein